MSQDVADLVRCAAWQLRDLFGRGVVTATEIAQAHLRAIDQHDVDLHAFTHVDPDGVLAQAAALDRARRLGEPLGPLAAVPLGVKDLIDTADAPTGYGSPVHAGHRPPEDAAVVTLCRQAGAVLAGKTVTTEFAYFHPGPTRNPHDPAHTPGGSSSGSAAAVAAGLVPLALGTQTAGSIIRPAAFCGVLGFKPTHGRVPRAGVKPLSDALDTVGGLARNLRDLALLMAQLTSDARLVTALDGAPGGRPPRIALVRTPGWDLAEAVVHDLWARVAGDLAAAGGVLHEPAWPAALPDLVELQLQIMRHEMARALRPEGRRHPAALSAALRELLAQGDTIDGGAHVEALQARDQARRVAPALFDHADVLLAPSTLGAAPRGLDRTGDPLFCRGWTLLGWPCIHLPLANTPAGLPIGLQLVGRPGADAALMAAAAWCLHRLAPARVEGAATTA